MADTNKVRYGIKNCYYALLTEDAQGNVTFGVPKELRGARSTNLAKEGSDDSKWYADDGVYFNIPGTNSGYAGDLTLAKIPDDFLIDVLGFFRDANNVLLEDAEATSKEFALIFEMSGDKHKTRHVLYRCTASRPDVNANTVEEQIEPEEETINVTAIPCKFTSEIQVKGETVTVTKTVVKAKSNEIDNPTAYNSWLTTVYMPSLTAEG